MGVALGGQVATEMLPDSFSRGMCVRALSSLLGPTPPGLASPGTQLAAALEDFLLNRKVSPVVSISPCLPRL